MIKFFFKKAVMKNVNVLEGERVLYRRANRWASRKMPKQPWTTNRPRYGSFHKAVVTVTDLEQEKTCSGFVVYLNNKEHQRALNKSKFVRRKTYKQLQQG